MDENIPLCNIAKSYITDVAINVSENVKQEALEVLLSLLTNKTTPTDANEAMRSLLGTSEPSEKINAILKIAAKSITSNYRIPVKEGYEKNQKKNDEDANYVHSSTLNWRQKTHNWSAYENQRLLAGIHIYGFSNWSLVADFVGNGRNRAQCSQRWNRGLDPTIIKGPWSEDEEEKLINLIAKYGNKQWKTIASHMDRRSDAQCRYHFAQMEKGKTAKNSSHTTSANKLDRKGRIIDESSANSDDALTEDNPKFVIKIKNDSIKNGFETAENLLDLEDTIFGNNIFGFDTNDFRENNELYKFWFQ